MVPEQDMIELNRRIEYFRLMRYRGIANSCSKCGKTGEFGLIEGYTCMSGNNYLVCGWCGGITLIEELIEG